MNGFALGVYLTSMCSEQVPGLDEAALRDAVDPTSGGVSSGVNHLECSLDGALFATCTSPQSFTGLAEGTHTFRVRAVDAAGNAVVVYRHGTNIRASRYNAATDAWTMPVGVETRTGGQAYSPSIAVDKNGLWLVIWQQDQAMSLKGLWQSTSTDGMTWSAPTAITTAAGSIPVAAPVLALNKDGTAVAAWTGRDPVAGNFPCVASIRSAGAWSAPVVM